MDVVDTDLSPRGTREDLCLCPAGGTARYGDAPRSNGVVGSELEGCGWTSMSSLVEKTPLNVLRRLCLGRTSGSGSRLTADVDCESGDGALALGFDAALGSRERGALCKNRSAISDGMQTEWNITYIRGVGGHW